MDNITVKVSFDDKGSMPFPSKSVYDSNERIVSNPDWDSADHQVDVNQKTFSNMTRKLEL